MDKLSNTTVRELYCGFFENELFEGNVKMMLAFLYGSLLAYDNVREYYYKRQIANEIKEIERFLIE